MAGRAQGRRRSRRIDVAFSRDAPEKVYVQHRMWEQPPRSGRMARRRRALLCLRRRQGDGQGRPLDPGARLCGREGAAPEAAEKAVEALERGQRFLQDVY